MSRTVKFALYAICVIGVIVFGVLTRNAYRLAEQSSQKADERAARASATEATNAAAAAQGETAAPSGATGVLAGAATVTNKPAVAKKESGDSDAPQAAGTSARGYTKMITRALGLVLFVIGLAVLIGYDVAHFFGQRAQEALFSEDGQPVDPEYEKAEQLWADGHYLDAVRSMREYLNKNPREQYVALRIAEIYEQNLNNPLAAALEYEEVLKQKLPPERWGWAAIHLANIYSGKLNQSEKSIALLRRIDAEYGQTAAAKKARERLTQVDPDFVPTPQPDEVAAAEEEIPAEPAPPAQPSLPPGFRPKS